MRITFCADDMKRETRTLITAPPSKAIENKKNWFDDSTYQTAHEIAQEAGNYNAKKHGRDKWNLDDYQIACDRFDSLIPNPLDHNVPKNI